MTSEAGKQIKALETKVLHFAAAEGEGVVQLVQGASLPLLHWINYLSVGQRTKTADGLLDAVTSSVREGAACMALGLVRPALFSLRTQIDLLLAWLYFKDHPIEWKLVNDSGEGFKLKREIIDYLGDHFPGFKIRLSLLKDVIDRSTDDPYRLLSAHVHAQSGPVLPVTNNLSDVVSDVALTNECAKIVGETAEYLGDILVSIYAGDWLSLPADIRIAIENRLKKKKGYTERFFKLC